MKLGITEYIDCAHHLPGHSKCGRLHGHTYTIDVVIEGEKKGGMIVDFADLKTAVKNKEIEKMKPLDESEVIAVLNTLVKQRKDSIDQFRKGARGALVPAVAGCLDELVLTNNREIGLHDAASFHGPGL